MAISIITENQCLLYSESIRYMDNLFPHWAVSLISAGPLWDNLSIRFLSANRDWWHPQQNWWFECGIGRIRWPCFGWWGWGDVNGCNSHSGPHSYISFSFFMLRSVICLNVDPFALWFWMNYQVVVGSFIVGGKTPKPLPLKHKPSPVPPHMQSFGAARTTSPPSQSTTCESPDEPSSPLDPSSGAFNNSVQSIQPMSSYAPPGWTGSHSVDPQKKWLTNVNQEHD